MVPKRISLRSIRFISNARFANQYLVGNPSDLLTFRAMCCFCKQTRNLRHDDVLNFLGAEQRSRPCGTASTSIASTALRSFRRSAKDFAGLSEKSQTSRRTLEGKSTNSENWNVGRLDRANRELRRTQKNNNGSVGRDPIGATAAPRWRLHSSRLESQSGHFRRFQRRLSAN